MIAALALAVLVAAEPGAAVRGSPRWGAVDVGVQTYRPDIDADFTPPGPYEQMFGTSRGWMLRLGVSKALYTGFGSLEAGVRTGYFRDSAYMFVEGGGRSIVKTKFHIIPTSLSLTYRFDWLVDRYRYVPLAPYVRGTLERYNWWVSDDDGEVESGATNGWSASVGLAFLLDILDPQSARDLDRESGVNHTYLFFEATKSSVDDFGSSSSWNLSDEELSLAGGLLFVF